MFARPGRLIHRALRLHRLDPLKGVRHKGAGPEDSKGDTRALKQRLAGLKRRPPADAQLYAQRREHHQVCDASRLRRLDHVLRLYRYVAGGEQKGLLYVAESLGDRGRVVEITAKRLYAIK